MSEEADYSELVAKQDGNGAFEKIKRAPDSYAERMRQLYC